VTGPGFGYVRSMGAYYRPRTPRAALVAASAGILPTEAIVFKASSVKPLFEEPYDLEELDRVLAQESLSFGDAMNLAEIFVIMTRDPDKERALFAAESLTALENRWARRSEAQRAEMEGSPGDQRAAFLYARSMYERAMLAGRMAPIRNFYLLKAYYVLCQHRDAEGGGPGFNLLIRCLLRLGLYGQAEFDIRMRRGRGGDGELLALAVETAYLRKDVARIRELVDGVDLGSLGLDEELRSLLEAWKA
jgi:hypothetical protein